MRRYGEDPFADEVPLWDMTQPLSANPKPKRRKNQAVKPGETPKKRGRPRKHPADSTRMKRVWDGRFIAVDGEGWDGKYTLLQMTGEIDLFNSDGLSTMDILDYVADSHYGSWNAFVGFGLSYDFENWLRDIPDLEFDLLLDGETIQYGRYQLRYIPRKMLQIEFPMRNGRMRRLQISDVLGFFQDSFIGALEKWEIDVPEIIRRGKAMREEFRPDQLDFVRQYNRHELLKICQLMEALREADEMAWQAIGLDANQGPRIWYGPGSRAANFLEQTGWIEEHPVLWLPDEVPDWAKEQLIPVHIVEKVAHSLAEEQRELLGLRRDIVKEVRIHGGIRPPKPGDMYATEYRERVPMAVHRRVVSKRGLALDEMADELRLSVDELLEELVQWEPHVPIYDRDFEEKARQELVELGDRAVWEHMFSLAYYGGRIEAAAVGEFREVLWGYDINSAYPYAITHLPRWDAWDLRWVDGLDERHRMGMYYVRWWLPEGANFYPFPYRSRAGNVFFPRCGEGWVMSPELYAALAYWPLTTAPSYESGTTADYGIAVLGGLVLEGTDGGGDGMTYLSAEKRCMTALKMEEMAEVRLKAKHDGLPYEKSLKTIINSGYGKLIQQVGSHRFLNTFAASWITSTCRAMIYRAIGPDWDREVIAVMTDGVLARKRLTVSLGEKLGEWEEKRYDHAIQLLPGVYKLHQVEPKEKEIRKYRGVSKDIDYEAALAAWRRGEKYPVSVRIFVSRSLARHQREAFGDKMYQFVDFVREEDFSLRSKREVTGSEDRSQSVVWFPPKTAPVGEPSRGYHLELDPVEVPYDFTTSLEELGSVGLATALLDEAL